MTKTYPLERTQIIERSRADTFSFFSDAFNLERITPAFLGFKILTPPPIEMRAGTVLDYRLSLFGFSFNWKTLIERWNPEESFVDVQLKGPYSLWRHTHLFEDAGRNRTLVRDRVEYRLPCGVLGRVARAAFVAKSLERIFDHREKTIASLMQPDRPAAS